MAVSDEVKFAWKLELRPDIKSDEAPSKCGTSYELDTAETPLGRQQTPLPA